MSDTPDKLCWLCKKNPTARTTGTRGYSTSLCAACKSKLNGSVGVDPFETSRPLTEIEYEQRGRIARLERELADMTAAKDKAVGALKGCVEQMGHTLPYSFAPDGMDKLIAELEEVK